METKGLIAVKNHQAFLFASGPPAKLLETAVELELGELKLSSRRHVHVKGSKQNQNQLQKEKNDSVGFASF